MVIYPIINQVDSCQSCVCGHLTCDTKNILVIDDHVLIMTYDSLVMGSPRHQISDMT